MELKKYFWDSYAVVDLIKGNPNYLEFKDEEIVLTVFNIAEIYFSALRDLGEVIAEEVYEDYAPLIVNLSENVLKKAMRFKLKNKQTNLSYADCIGYIYALENNLVFLTGDKEFENLPNVEFVK